MRESLTPTNDQKRQSHHAGKKACNSENTHDDALGVMAVCPTPVQPIKTESGVEVEPPGRIETAFISPTLVHLNVQEEMDAPVEQFLEFYSG